jgi:hypothetical protein
MDLCLRKIKPNADTAISNPLSKCIYKLPLPKFLHIKIKYLIKYILKFYMYNEISTRMYIDTVNNKNV